MSFSSLCDWFIDTKLSIHLCADKTKSILFKTKFNIEQPEPLLFMAGSKLSNNFLELPSGPESETLDWGKKGVVDFNPRKTQLVLFDQCNNWGAIDVTVGGSALEEKLFLKMLKSFSSKLDWEF